VYGLLVVSGKGPGEIGYERFGSNFRPRTNYMCTIDLAIAICSSTHLCIIGQ